MHVDVLLHRWEKERHRRGVRNELIARIAHLLPRWKLVGLRNREVPASLLLRDDDPAAAADERTRARLEERSDIRRDLELAERALTIGVLQRGATHRSAIHSRAIPKMTPT